MGEPDIIGNHYDQMIWKVFSVGIFYSILILYAFWEVEWKNFNLKLVALFFGFILINYSLILFLNYNRKKRLFYHKSNYKGYLSRNGFPRVTWFAEFIVFGIMLIYLYSFYYLDLAYLALSLIISCIMISLSISRFKQNKIF